MKPSVYVETTIPSYLTAWRSPELLMAARQQVTRGWWDTRRNDFELFVSQLVVDEASDGDPDAAARRLAVVAGIQLLAATDAGEQLTEMLICALALPAKATADAAHIAMTVVNEIDYLLTWNCTHIANASFRPKIEAACNGFGYRMPVICTPEELMEKVKMKLDPVLAEIRKTREEYSMRFGGDVKAMFADLRKRQAEGGRTTVSRPAKRIPKDEIRQAETPKSQAAQ